MIEPKHNLQTDTNGTGNIYRRCVRWKCDDTFLLDQKSQRAKKWHCWFFGFDIGMMCVWRCMLDCHCLFESLSSSSSSSSKTFDKVLKYRASFYHNLIMQFALLHKYLGKLFQFPLDPHGRISNIYVAKWLCCGSVKFGYKFLKRH